jgi:dynein heavy chain
LNWMYLQPIFDSPDIAKQLPNESKKFKGVDAFWKNTINKARELANVEKICQVDEQLEKIRDNNTLLDMIQKELNSYLEKKRERFARFFFLGNN